MKKILLDFILGISLSYSAIITSVVADIILGTLFITPIAMIALTIFAINGIHRKGKKC